MSVQARTRGRHHLSPIRPWIATRRPPRSTRPSMQRRWGRRKHARRESPIVVAHTGKGMIRSNLAQKQARFLLVCADPLLPNDALCVCPAGGLALALYLATKARQANLRGDSDIADACDYLLFFVRAEHLHQRKIRDKGQERRGKYR
jgi:hypothetical protein